MIYPHDQQFFHCRLDGNFENSRKPFSAFHSLRSPFSWFRPPLTERPFDFDNMGACRPGICDQSSPTSTQSGEDSSCPSPVNNWHMWKCGQCNKTFSQRILLQMHVCKSVANKPYQCGHCAESFAQPNALRNHVITHSNDRPFKCGFCSRSFAGATTLNNHIRTHTGEKPFRCDKCGKEFSQATQLSRHLRTPSDCSI